MHDDGAATARNGARSEHVRVRSGLAGVTVPEAELGPDRLRAGVEEHREVVVRRLLGHGLSPALLRTLLPEFDGLVDRLSR